MRAPRTLHGRLTLAYATALFAGLCLFAAVSGFSMVRLSGAVLDTRLRATAAAVAGFAADSEPGIIFDSGDSEQFRRMVTTRLDAALLRADGSLVIETSAGVPPTVRDALRSAGATNSLATVTSQGEELRVALAPVYQEKRLAGTVAVWASMSSIEDFQRLLIVVFGVGIPVIVGLAVISAGFVTRRGLAPVRDIAQLATQIEASDLSQRLRPQSDEDEIGSLSATFDRMLDRLQAAFERQRQFTADASHELRAPLAIIRAEADLALRRQRNPDEYRRALESIASEADRLEALIAELLALARAEAGPKHASSTVDLSALVNEAIDRLSAVAEGHGVRIERNIVGPAPVRGDSAALARASLALVHNAVKYATAGGAVRVAVSRNGANETVLSVNDDGPGFSEEGLRRATERFWRDDRVRDHSGSGLGLAIVRAIVEQSGASMELQNNPGGGAEVRVRFPGSTA